MNQKEAVPVARYLRMSTERQQYSLSNQSEEIQRYAENHGYSIVRTYSDEAKTGVIFRKRLGLQKLIQDVAHGKPGYKAILVYDVSRWGRPQDIDEAAHYEFLCKSAGVPVIYCAETFSDDGSLPSLIMKSLKRAMAGEYSRELGVKVHAAQKRFAQLGFRQGGQPGYGLRRLLISPDGTPKQLLDHGERKCIATDRVIQVPGPREEVECVREIYRLLIQEHLSFRAIARELNRRKMKYMEGKEWGHSAVNSILTHPKYAGFNVYGRTSERLYTPVVHLPRTEWIMLAGAFEPLVDSATFAEAQGILATYTRNKSDEKMLDVLRAILAREGRITTTLIENTPDAPSVTTYMMRFGAVSRAYDLIGYDCHRQPDWLECLRRVRTLRENLLKAIVALSRARISIEDRGRIFRSRLRLQSGRRISVIASRHFMNHSVVRWRVKSTRTDCRLMTLVGFVNPENTAFVRFCVTAPLRTTKQIIWSEGEARQHRAIYLNTIHGFYHAIEKISRL